MDFINPSPEMLHNRVKTDAEITKRLLCFHPNFRVFFKVKAVIISSVP